MRGRTTLVIAHRPATIALADRVAVVDDGRVVEQGTHAELLARSPRYRSLLALAARRRHDPRAHRPDPAAAAPADRRWPGSRWSARRRSRSPRRCSSKIAIDQRHPQARRARDRRRSRSSTSCSSLVRPVLERVIVLCSARAGERFLGDLRVAAYDKLQAALDAVLRGDARRRARLAADRRRPDADDVHAPRARRGRRLGAALRRLARRSSSRSRRCSRS